MLPDDELWRRLSAFSLDIPGAALPFSARLARDNGWSPAFAARVCREYLRFIYLAMRAGHPVTPSDEVDQAWHLHLCYTRSYWDELCGEVLGERLHHGPTRGGRAEGAKFEDWYERTLDSYRRIFGETLPPDIWPDAATRFGEAAHFRRVNLKRHLVVPRPRLAMATRLARANRWIAATRSGGATRLATPGTWARCAPLLLLLLAAGCGAVSYGASQSANPFDWYGSEFLTLFGWMCALGLGAAFWRRGRGRTPSDREFPIELLDPYLVARLSDEGNITVDAALAALYARGEIAQNERGQLERAGVQAPAHPFEARVWNAVGAQTSLNGVRGALAQVLESFDRELEKLGLLVAPDAQWRANAWPAATALLLCVFGAIKIVVGLNRGRPVGYLALACGALLVLAVAMVAGFRVRRSERGEAYLQQLREQTPRASSGTLPLEGLMIVSALALWGYSELDALGLGALHKTLQPPSSGGDGGGSGCGSDGGSGCGGGGCGGGGCGGCGS